MKPNEIIAALRQCEVNNPGACRKCPAYNQSAGCLDLLHQEAAELIEGLEKKLKSAVRDLSMASECWSCKRNSKCHPDMPVKGPDVCCGSYVWCGVTDTNVGIKDEYRWIPVTERLPESGVRVIVCRGDKVEQGVFLGVNGWWKVYGTNTKKVTHWKPLPEPPGGIET